MRTNNQNTNKTPKRINWSAFESGRTRYLVPGEDFPKGMEKSVRCSAHQAASRREMRALTFICEDGSLAVRFVRLKPRKTPVDSSAKR